jgi:type II secretory pathway pseudopilin PulG
MKSATRGPDLRRPDGGFTLIEVLVVIAEELGGPEPAS